MKKGSCFKMLVFALAIGCSIFHSIPSAHALGAFYVEMNGTCMRCTYRLSRDFPICREALIPQMCEDIF